MLFLPPPVSVVVVRILRLPLKEMVLALDSSRDCNSASSESLVFVSRFFLAEQNRTHFEEQNRTEQKNVLKLMKIDGQSWIIARKKSVQEKEKMNIVQQQQQIVVDRKAEPFLHPTKRTEVQCP